VIGNRIFSVKCYENLNDLGMPPDDICRYTEHSNVQQIHAYAKIKKTRLIRIFNEKLKEFEEKNK
jgi:hypothetical protein